MIYFIENTVSGNIRIAKAISRERVHAQLRWIQSSARDPLVLLGMICGRASDARRLNEFLSGIEVRRGIFIVAPCHRAVIVAMLKTNETETVLVPRLTDDELLDLDFDDDLFRRFPVARAYLQSKFSF